MSATTERKRIERPQWPQFCEMFTRLHRGWRVTVGTLSTRLLETAEEASAHLVAEGVPFRGLSVDDKSGGAGFVVLLGQEGQHYTHELPNPGSLYVETLDDGSHKGIRIDDDQGQTLLIRFHASARTEELDGLIEAER